MRKLLVFLVAGFILLASLSLVSATGSPPICTDNADNGISCPNNCQVQVLEPETGVWYDPVTIKWTFTGNCDPSTYTLQYQKSTEGSLTWHSIATVDSAEIPMEYDSWSPAEGDYKVRVRMDQGTGIHVSGYSGFFHIDLTDPVLTKTVGTPKVSCESEECDYYVTTETPITLSCDDGKGSGVDYIEYTINDGEPVKVYKSEVTFSFAEPSQHELEAKCVDKVGKESNVDNEIFFVDTKAPEITKTVNGPKVGDCPPNSLDDKCYIAVDETEIQVSAVDSGEHQVGVDKCYYWYYVGDQRFPSSGTYSTFPITFPQESSHELHLVCKDLLGNKVEDVEIFLVDDSAPETSVGFEGPYYEEQGVEWIDGVSKVVLTAQDSGPHPSGIADTYYRTQLVQDESYCNRERDWSEWETTSKNALDWNTYEGSFPIAEQSCHAIEYYSVDALGNEEDVQVYFVFVDKTAPKNIKEVGKPSHECGEDDSKCLENWDWVITMDTPITLSCEDQNPHPSGVGEICYRWFLDGDLVIEDGSNEEGWICLSQDEVVVQFNEESEHQLDFYCVDNVNKKSEVDSELFKVEGKEFVIKLYKKWNLISIPFNLIGSDVKEVFDQLGDNLEIVWGYDNITGGWHVYSPDGPSDLETIEPGYGYWVKVKEDAELKVGGSLLSPGPGVPPSRPVVKGWNLIGHYGLDEKSAYCSLLSLVDTNIGHPRWSALFGYDAVSDEFESLNTLDTTYPGKGYWVEMDVDDSYSPATACFDWS
jgi:hypothetical protein